VWFDILLPGAKTRIKDCAYLYPDPSTHQHVRNCVTFLPGKGIEVKVTES
jgi:hypothetical protein